MKVVKFIFERVLEVFFEALFLVIGEPKISVPLKKTIDLYSESGFASLFAKIRAWDAPYDLVGRLVPKAGKILDLGSGDGLMANFLALSEKKRDVFGIELNKDRVSESYKGLKNTKFEAGDIVKHKFPKVKTVLLIHVLHHLPSLSDQERLLKRVSKLLGRGGRLIILEIDNAPVLKYLFSFFTDAVIVPILFEKKIVSLNFHYRKSREWVELLKLNNFSVNKIKAAHKGMPFSHVLISAIKK